MTMRRAFYCGFDKRREYGSAEESIFGDVRVRAKVFPVGFVSRLLWSLMRCTVNVVVETEPEQQQ